MPKLKQIIPTNAPEQLNLNAGIFVKGMTIEELQATVTGDVMVIPEENILGLSSGDISVSCVPTITDLGADINGLKGKVAQMQYITEYETSISGTLVTASEEQIKMMIGSAELTKTDGLTKITPKEGFIDETLFETIMLVGEKGANGIWIVELKQSFNTGGFTQTSKNKDKSTFDVELSGHYDIAALEECPMSFYTLTETGGGA